MRAHKAEMLREKDRHCLDNLGQGCQLKNQLVRRVEDPTGKTPHQVNL